ncbi:MAG TPA: hypothetical protein VMW23_08905 [Sedimentisphaerales bacterium]|nr:hypothetical protein [Sedimentisphaerales bacterium]
MPKTRKQNTKASRTDTASSGTREVGRGHSHSGAKASGVDEAVLAAFDAVEFGDTARRGHGTGKSAGRVVEDAPMRMEDYADVSEERASIISIVRGLEGQVETAFKLKEVLETELDGVHKKLSEESAVRAHLEARVSSLEAEAALVEQLREDIAFAEEERNKFATQAAEMRPQLEATTRERNSQADEMTSLKAHTKALEGEKMALEAQVMNLKDKVADIEHMREEVDKLTQMRRELDEQVRELADSLESSDTTKNILEKELDSVREEIEVLRYKLSEADGRGADMRGQLEDQQATNRSLMEIKARQDSEIKTLKANYETSKTELTAFKSALHDIRSEATRTSGRVRQRYFKPRN